MPRPVSRRVELVKQKLLARLNDGFHRSGDRFSSARAISAQFGLSYQTADRLLNQLVALGKLERRKASGTFVAGRAVRWLGVQFIFDRRARRAGSFGAGLVRLLTDSFRRAGITTHVTYVDQPTRPAFNRFPIFWDVDPGDVHFGLVLNDRPAIGLKSIHLDSISVDDRLGGVFAAELIARRVPARCKLAVVAGPAGDRRSDNRVDGFLSVRSAQVFHAPTWFHADALPVARQLIRYKPGGVFACNDRLAQAVLDVANESNAPAPVLFGFDNAPIAESLHLSTISLPWQPLAESVTALVQKRLAGDRSPASHLILTPRPILRLTG